MGLATFLLDSFKIIKLSYFTFTGLFCAANTDITCTMQVIELLVKFIVDIIAGPAYIAIFLSNFGLIDSFLALGVLIFAYGPTAYEGSQQIR